MDIYLVAIGGTGMAPLACLLRELGHQVRGSDQPLYPPMSDMLAQAGITPLVGWDPAHLEPAPELVVIGNAVPRTNPEVDAVEVRGLARVSMPEALARFVLSDRSPLVVAGTHGKTTTTALAAFVFERCGANPGYLIGGLPVDLPSSFALGSGPTFVIEGDEYNSAWFDRGPKFLHYRPQTLILTSAEHDHLDLYPTRESLLEKYCQLVAEMDPSSLVIACIDDPEVREVLPAARARVITYGLAPADPALGPTPDRPTPDRVVHLRGDGPQGIVLGLPAAGEEIEVPTRLVGDHGARNALAVWIAALEAGLPVGAAAAALGSFRGVRRRAEVVGEHAGITVIDDFAHHPTAVGTTLRGLARRYPGRRLVAVFEPRSLTSGRRTFTAQWTEALAAAGVVVFAPVFHRERLGPEALDTAALATRLTRPERPAFALAAGADTAAYLLDLVKPGDVVVTMSSGSFDGLPRRLSAALAVARDDGPTSTTAGVPPRPPPLRWG